MGRHSIALDVCYRTLKWWLWEKLDYMTAMPQLHLQGCVLDNRGAYIMAS